MDSLSKAALVAPPVSPTVVNVNAAATSAAQDTTVALFNDQWINVVMGQAGDLNFGATSSVAAPADKASFPAGTYRFVLDANSRYFKITLHVTGSFTWWISSK